MKNETFLRGYLDNRIRLGYVSDTNGFYDYRVKEKSKISPGGPAILWITTLYVDKEVKIGIYEDEYLPFKYSPDILNIDKYAKLEEVVKMYGDKYRYFAIPVTALFQLDKEREKKFRVVCCIGACICDNKKHNFKEELTNGRKVFVRIVVEKC